MARVGPITSVPDRRVFRQLTSLATAAATGLLAAVALVGVSYGVRGLPPLRLGIWHWTALAVTGAAVVLRLGDRRARMPAAGVYGFVLIVLAWVWIERGFSPGTFFLWGSICELAGFALLAALVGWAAPQIACRFSLPGVFQIPDRWSRRWFDPAQLTLVAATAFLAAWISLDFRFDGLGRGIALFGLMGRSAGCAAALMLVGASIVMAWQTGGAWRSVWQYAAMTAGLVFTTSVGWARLDSAEYLASGWSPWPDRFAALTISASMMTVMSGLGLSRVLPKGSDWIVRGRQAMPAFAGLALVMLGIVWNLR